MADTSLKRTQLAERPATAPAMRVLHWYPGYGDGGAMEPPPAGAKSACGVERKTGRLGRTTKFGNPDACVVCHDLWLLEH